MVVEVQVWQVYAAWGLFAILLFSICVMAATIKVMYRNEYLLRLNTITLGKKTASEQQKVCKSKECRTK